MDTIIIQVAKPQCFVCNQEEGPFMDPMPCSCRGTIALHAACYEQLKEFYSSCSTCHTDYPREYRDGLIISRGIDGTYRYEGTVDEDDNWHGIYKEWDSHNKLTREYNFVHGDKHGICIKYNPNGTIIKKYNYKSGKKHGSCISFYDSGNIMNQYNFLEGKENGLCSRYFHNGVLAEESTYINGECEGITRTYMSDGRLHVCSSFKAGKLDGYVFSYNYEGRIISRELFRNDLIIECVRY